MGTTFPLSWPDEGAALGVIERLARGGLEHVRAEFERTDVADSQARYWFDRSADALKGMVQDPETGEWPDYELPYSTHLARLLSRAGRDVVRDFVSVARNQGSSDGARYQLRWRTERLAKARSEAESLPTDSGAALLVELIDKLTERLREEAVRFIPLAPPAPERSAADVIHTYKESHGNRRYTNSETNYVVDAFWELRCRHPETPRGKLCDEEFARAWAEVEGGYQYEHPDGRKSAVFPKVYPANNSRKGREFPPDRRMVTDWVKRAEGAGLLREEGVQS